MNDDATDSTLRIEWINSNPVKLRSPSLLRASSLRKLQRRSEKIGEIDTDYDDTKKDKMSFVS